MEKEPIIGGYTMEAVNPNTAKLESMSRNKIIWLKRLDKFATKLTMVSIIGLCSMCAAFFSLTMMSVMAQLAPEVVTTPGSAGGVVIAMLVFFVGYEWCWRMMEDPTEGRTFGVFARFWVLLLAAIIFDVTWQGVNTATTQAIGVLLPVALIIVPGALIEMYTGKAATWVINRVKAFFAPGEKLKALREFEPVA